MPNSKLHYSCFNEFDFEDLKEPLTLLSGRLAKYRTESIAGTQYTDEERVENNRILKTFYPS